MYVLLDDKTLLMGPSWSWLYVTWIYNNLCNLCLSPLTTGSIKIMFPHKESFIWNMRNKLRHTTYKLQNVHHFGGKQPWSQTVYIEHGNIIWVIIIEYRRKPCIIRRNLPFKGIFWVVLYLYCVQTTGGKAEPNKHK
jgi:hypothetical protein